MHDIDTYFRIVYEHLVLYFRFSLKYILLYVILKMMIENLARLIIHDFKLRSIIKIRSRRTLIRRQRMSIWKFDNISFRYFARPR